jgi:hypothetical protein
MAEDGKNKRYSTPMIGRNELVSFGGKTVQRPVQKAARDSSESGVTSSVSSQSGGCNDSDDSEDLWSTRLMEA